MRKLSQVIGTAWATWAVGFPLAIGFVIYGLDALIWLIEHLPV